MVGLLTDNCPGGDVPVELIWAHPGLLSDHALELLAGRVGQKNCPPFLRRCYAGLRSAADRLASGELRVRLGNGPLERLGQRAEGDLTMAATIALAGEPETYWDLSTRYVAAATSSLRDQMHEHRTGRLVLFARLAAVAVEALFREQWGTATARPPGLSDAAFAESLTCLYWSVAVYAELAGEHFMAHRDPRVFADADRRLAFLAEVTKASDETEALVDVLRRRAVLHAAAPIDLLACRTSAMGAILLATSTTTPRMPEEAGRFFTYAADLGWGLRFEGSEAGVLDLPEQDLADDAVLLANARGYLDQARRAAGGGPAGDLAGLRLHIAVRQEKTDLTAATITRLAREVLAAPEPKSPMFQFLALSRSRARRDQCVPELENFLAATPVMVARADGLRAAQWAVIEAVSLAWQVAPEYVGRLLAAAESIFPEFSPRRIVLTRLHAEYLVRGDRKLAEACLRGSRGDLSGTVDAVIELAPSVAGQHPGAVNFLLLTVAPAAALAAQLAGDADAQRQAWLYALSVACVLRYWNIAYPVFRHVLEDVTAQHGAGGAAAVRTLAGCAAVLEACLGDLATDRLQVIYRETLSHFSRSGAGIDDILLTVDLAKGHRFSGARAWLGSHGGQVSDGLALPELGQAALAPDLTGLSQDEHWLREMRAATAESVPYREDLDLRRRDSQVYELPKRRFDAGIYSAAFAGGTGDPVPLTSQLENLLDDSELVLDLYLGRTPDAERAVFVTACSNRGWALTTQPIPFAIPRPVSEDEAEFFAPLTAEGIDLVNRLTGARRRGGQGRGHGGAPVPGVPDRPGAIQPAAPVRSPRGAARAAQAAGYEPGPAARPGGRRHRAAPGPGRDQADHHPARPVPRLPVPPAVPGRSAARAALLRHLRAHHAQPHDPARLRPAVPAGRVRLRSRRPAGRLSRAARRHRRGGRDSGHVQGPAEGGQCGDRDRVPGRRGAVTLRPHRHPRRDRHRAVIPPPGHRARGRQPAARAAVRVPDPGPGPARRRAGHPQRLHDVAGAVRQRRQPAGYRGQPPAPRSPLRGRYPVAGQDRGRPPLLRRAVPRRSRGSAGAGRLLGRAAGHPRPLPGPAGLGSLRPDRLEVRKQKWKSSCPS
jgi:hypothetical protein